MQMNKAQMQKRVAAYRSDIARKHKYTSSFLRINSFSQSNVAGETQQGRIQDWARNILLSEQHSKALWTVLAKTLICTVVQVNIKLLVTNIKTLYLL